MNKTVYVQSHFQPIGKKVEVNVPTGEKKTSFLGRELDVTRTETRWEQTGWSDCEVDGARLAKDVQNAISKLNEEGYVVVSVTPITSGRYNYAVNPVAANVDIGNVRGSYAYGYGYSFTEGVVIIGQMKS